MNNDCANKRPWIKTPLIWSRTLSQSAGCQVYLKMENLQPSGSFKSRGMGAFVRANLPTDGSDQKTHFFCSSGGNAGLGCVSAAVTLGCPATIVVPMSTSDYMISKLRDGGATEVIQKGASWYEADQYLQQEVLPQARERGEKAVYVPPFEAPEIWAGHSTLVDELVEQLREVDSHYPTNAPLQRGANIGANGTSKTAEDAVMMPDALVCSVGGGGLFNGMIQGINRYKTRSSTKTKVLAVETVGADSLAQSVQAGKLITLPKITSIATTLGARTVSPTAFENAMDGDVVTCAVLTDKEAVDGCRRFANDERVLVEPSCGVSLAVCYTGKLRELLPDLKPTSRVVVVVCGGSGLSLDILNKYVKDYLD